MILNASRPIIPKSISNTATIRRNLRISDWLSFKVEPHNLIFGIKVPEVKISFASSSIEEVLLLGMEPYSMDWEQLILVSLLMLMAFKSKDIIQLNSAIAISLSIRQVGSSIMR